jgi:hypothetical protein
MRQLASSLLAAFIAALAACAPGAREDAVDATVPQCDPNASAGLACAGNSVVQCNLDGTLGGLVESCGSQTTCQGGVCVSGVACGTGVEDVFVVDTANNLLRFDPRLVDSGAAAFTLIGQLDCHTQFVDLRPPNGLPSPFSMSVGRDGTAWILYSSGEMFGASTENATCATIGYPRRQQDMNLFGMGFASDAAGSNSEHLYVAGGAIQNLAGGRFASIDPVSKELTVLGNVTSNAEYSPELTGTGNGDLFGFFPGISDAFVQQVDKATGGEVGPRWNIPGGFGSTLAAFAFAHWGGRFYLFVTLYDSSGSANSQVQLIDPESGQHQVLVQGLEWTIVGAGVSTCAPVEVE